jgi:hypothetical protein
MQWISEKENTKCAYICLAPDKDQWRAIKCHLRTMAIYIRFYSTSNKGVRSSETDTNRGKQALGENTIPASICPSQTLSGVALSKAWVCGRSLSGIQASNPACDEGWMSAPCECCVVW